LDKKKNTVHSGAVVAFEIKIIPAINSYIRIERAQDIG
jgi:hypothetical protein